MSSQTALWSFPGWDDCDMARNFHPHKILDHERVLLGLRSFSHDRPRIIYQGYRPFSMTVTILASGLVLDRSREEDTVAGVDLGISLTDPAGCSKVHAKAVIRQLIKSDHPKDVWWDREYEGTPDFASYTSHENDHRRTLDGTDGEENLQISFLGYDSESRYTFTVLEKGTVRQVRTRGQSELPLAWWLGEDEMAAETPSAPTKASITRLIEKYGLRVKWWSHNMNPEWRTSQADQSSQDGKVMANSMSESSEALTNPSVPAGTLGHGPEVRE